MQADIIYQLMNPLVFVVFAMGFFAIHKIRTDRSALFIGMSYVVGAIAFVSDLIFATSENIPIRTGIAALYALTTIFIVGGCSVYYRKRAPWRTYAIMLAVHLAVYVTLLALETHWLRSLTVNYGVGLIFLVGLLHIRAHMKRALDKLLFIVGIMNCAQCFIRPTALLILVGGTFDAATHDETMLIMSLHLFMAVSAITIAMAMFLVLGRDIIEDLQAHSDTDPLTSLLNRRGLTKQTEQLFGSAKHSPICVIIADIDKFKMVNDRFGHATGDDVIRIIGGVIADGVPKEALVARLGGEEFIAVLPTTDLIDARHIAETLRQIFEATSIRSGPDIIKCTASFGVAQAQAGETLDQLTVRADRALYLAKNAGRNCIKCEGDLAISKLRKLHQELLRHAPMETPESAASTS